MTPCSRSRSRRRFSTSPRRLVIATVGRSRRRAPAVTPRAPRPADAPMRRSGFACRCNRWAEPWLDGRPRSTAATARNAATAPREGLSRCPADRHGAPRILLASGGYLLTWDGVPLRSCGHAGAAAQGCRGAAWASDSRRRRDHDQRWPLASALLTNVVGICLHQPHVTSGPLPRRMGRTLVSGRRATTATSGGLGCLLALAALSPTSVTATSAWHGL